MPAHPPAYPAHSWSSIEAFFARCEESDPCFAPMHALVSHIVRQEYVSLLFALTSMHTLVVSQHAEIDWTENVLRIELLSGGKEAEFEFVQNFLTRTKWKCDAAQMIHSFENFLRRTRWVSTSLEAIR